ncbi:MAG TPA: hypothetical protein VHB47_13335 [Thermoanaerobaculia bacterium]|nr:hypothetical protein [Thermoanaerobaculia bacterium]
MSHEQFWDAASRLARERRIPEMGKLIGPAVAARRTCRLTDLAGLIDRVESADESDREAGELLLRHVVGALVARPADGAPLVGAGSGPWCELLERLSRTAGGRRVYSLRPLLRLVCETPTAMSPSQMSNAGLAARRLLEFSWRQTPRDGHLVTQGIELVCRTFESDAAASAAMIRHVLDPARSEFRFEELPWLARQVPRLIALDAALVQEIYEVSYRHREPSTASTNLLGSNILPLISNRHQDFGMAHYELGNAFPQFLVQQPRHAVRALISALDAMMETERAIGGDGAEESFDFNGRQARLRADQSYRWDIHEEGGHWPAVKLLDSFERHLEALAAQGGSREALRAIVGAVVDESCLAVVWRRLLRQAVRFPDTLGREMLPAFAAKPILTCLETSYYAGEYLRAAFAGLDGSERERIERALMELPEDGAAREERARDRLLGCLPDELLVTTAARDHLAALRLAGGVPPNVAPFQMASHPAVLGPVSELSSPSVGPPRTLGDRVTALTRAVREVVDRDGQQPLVDAEVSTIVPRMRELVAALADCGAEGVDAGAVEAAWHALATAAARIAWREDFLPGDETGALVASILLAASRRPEPRPMQEIDGQLDASLSYTHPAPRVEGARGLLFLAGHAGGASAEVLERIDGLSRDPVPAVRGQVASLLNVLHESARAEMWAMLERLGREETSQGVLAAMVGDALERLAGRYTARIAAVVLEILERFGVVPESQRIRQSGTNLLARLYLWLDDPASSTATLRFAAHPKLFPDEACVLADVTREALRHGLAEGGEPAMEGVRARARDLLLRLLRAARISRDRLIADHEPVPFDAWPKEDQDVVGSLTRLIDQIAVEVYHASGAFHPNGPVNRGEILPEAGRQRFYQETGPLLDELAEIGLASIAHHLLQTLESFIAFDPAGVFVRMARVVASGRRGNYQFEALAVELIVRVVERYLAEHRHVFREDERCRVALLEILDVFVGAGWPSARQLTYRLDEMFR